MLLEVYHSYSWPNVLIAIQDDDEDDEEEMDDEDDEEMDDEEEESSPEKGSVTLSSKHYWSFIMLNLNKLMTC